jgi:SAM-dependent methyltransferase
MNRGPSTPAPTVDALTARTERVWSAGDYDRISAGFRHEAEAFVRRQSLAPGSRVLDAACGTGNLTIPAARAGAQVIGFDLIPALLDAARSWAAREQMRIEFKQGNAEELPFGDAQFDVVLSMFGVMFAARPEKVVAELARVTRPGGRVALANWVRDGFIGKLLGTHVKYAPPPAGLPSPILWGDEPVIQERFDSSQWSVVTTRHTLTFRYPHSPRGVAELFRGSYGPTVRTFDAITEDTRAELAGELTALWTAHARVGPGGSEIDSTYLQIVATRL